MSLKITRCSEKSLGVAQVRISLDEIGMSTVAH